MNQQANDKEELENLRECKRVLASYTAAGQGSWFEARKAALDAFKPPYVSVLTDKEVLRDCGTAVASLRDRRLMLADGISEIRKRAIFKGHGHVTQEELAEIVVAEREYANRSETENEQ